MRGVSRDAVCERCVRRGREVDSGPAAMDTEEGTPLAEEREGECGWRATLARRLPVLRWARRYTRAAAAADAVAGVTLGLMLVPQSIAYAALANLPAQYGLYSAFIGTILYVALGTVKEVSIGPTSLMALMTLQTCRGLPPDFVVLLSFLSGGVVLLMGLLRLGFLVELISPSVTSGFTSATAVIITVAQLKGLLGLSFMAESVTENVALIVERWRDVRLPDCLLSLLCCSTLLLLRKLKDVKVGPKRRKLKKTLWLVSIGRNALVVLAAAAFAYCTHDPARPLLRLSGRVEAGLPQLRLPPLSAEVGNRTLGFVDMVRELGTGVLLLPLVMVLANIAIAKAFSEGGRVDAAQEMVTLGLCNMAGGLVRAMPTCGAFTRSAVAHSSGVRTPAAGLYAGVITLLALQFLAQYFHFIPKACISSVLVCAVIFMVDWETALRLWRHDRRELAVVALTFGVGVWCSVELAVLCGALAGLAATHFALQRAPLHLHKVKCSWGEAVRARPTRALLYLNCARFAERLERATAAHRVALVDCGVLAMLDYPAAQALSKMIKKFQENNKLLIFYNASTDVIKKLDKVEGMDTRALLAHSVQAALDAVGPGPCPGALGPAAAPGPCPGALGPAAAPGPCLGPEAAALLPRDAAGV
ncbi:sodium-independent sulfate anion transporter [Papilio machaon]|uniref:sodium-independent sulfate anion transporter n=1 Tax=Papilio machaon TaxID=76193 RepID=UPI001E663B6A|nr:sodium-independent sulfate anion transporter [Papilio machaon]